jgi:poly-gamma-glutamate capsule biosynthesis protein CapA/YwtB (metallophosphatase superfamily)
MNGDVLLHNTLWWTARQYAHRTGRGVMDYRPMFADLRPVVSSADLAICHLETPLAPRGGPYYSYPVFSVPPSIVPALKWAGYDACTTASNHSLDQGFAGIKRTLTHLDRAGIAHAGTAVTRHASRTPLMLDANGVQVALIEATYGTNGLPLPAGKPWSVPIIKPSRILRMAAKARARGAQIVMVALHWGTEYVHQPSAYQTRIAARLSRSPNIDFIYGHHVHVVQPYDKVHGTWVVYGLGNTIAEQDPAVEGVYDGNTCRVTFREQPDGSFTVAKLQYIPTMITQYNGVRPMRVLDVPRALHQPRYASLRTQLRATAQRVRADVNLDGALGHGVSEGR